MIAYEPLIFMIMSCTSHQLMRASCMSMCPLKRDATIQTWGESARNWWGQPLLLIGYEIPTRSQNVCVNTWNYNRPVFFLRGEGSCADTVAYVYNCSFIFISSYSPFVFSFFFCCCFLRLPVYADERSGHQWSACMSSIWLTACHWLGEPVFVIDLNKCAHSSQTPALWVHQKEWLPPHKEWLLSTQNGFPHSQERYGMWKLLVKKFAFQSDPLFEGSHSQECMWAPQKLMSMSCESHQNRWCTMNAEFVV